MAQVLPNKHGITQLGLDLVSYQLNKDRISINAKKTIVLNYNFGKHKQEEKTHSS